MDSLEMFDTDSLFTPDDGTIDGIDIINIPIDDISNSATAKAQTLI